MFGKVYSAGKDLALCDAALTHNPFFLQVVAECSLG